jgi:ligand-binding sensor domain-containing protein
MIRKSIYYAVWLFMLGMVIEGFPQDTGWTYYPYRNVNALLEDHSGNIWVGTDSGLTIFNGKSWKDDFMPDSVFKGPRRCLSLAEDSTHTIFVSVGYSLISYSYDDSSWTNYSMLPDSLTILCLLADTKGHIWAGFFDAHDGGGVFLYDRVKWTRADSGIGGLVYPTSLVEDTLRNSIWIGDPWTGLSKYDGQTWVIGINRNDTLYPHGYYQSVFCLTKDLSCNLWLRTFDNTPNYIALGFNDAHWIKFDSLFPGVPGVISQFLLQNSQADIWVHIRNIGIAKYSGNKWELIGGSILADRNNRIVFLLDMSGRIWVETTQGLASYQSGASLRIQRPDSKKNSPSDLPGLRNSKAAFFDLQGRTMRLGARPTSGVYGGVYIVKEPGKAARVVVGK